MVLVLVNYNSPDYWLIALKFQLWYIYVCLPRSFSACIIKGTVHPKIQMFSGRPRLGWVCVFIRFGEMCLSNGCSAVNGCRKNESQWMLCSEWVPSEWESMDAQQWMGAVRMRVNGCSAVNGCRQNESQWMLCSEWVPSEWESDKNITALQSIS